ncbi:MAG TPA: exo-alpha-sialidase, partial [Armatimonadota bacterium]|nr:exo-alpha-sialidase [Armatimonadota bacterium]
MLSRVLSVVLLTLAMLPEALAQSLAPATAPYVWKSVQIVGGGFVDGIIFHPTAKGVRYARTDMGGAYRWNQEAQRWEPILDWMPYKDLNLMGVESIALDASDPTRVYLACGTYTDAETPDGAILRSTDGGKVFQRTDVPIKFGGNENGRGNGERMAVDPNDGRILFLGTRHAGLWGSRDSGVSWKRVESFPDVSEPKPDHRQPDWWAQVGSGIVFVVFDPASGKRGKASSTIYVGVSLMGRDNLFRSTDGGKTWRAVPGAPTRYRPTHGVLASDGTLYLS